MEEIYGSCRVKDDWSEATGSDVTHVVATTWVREQTRCIAAPESLPTEDMLCIHTQRPYLLIQICAS